MTVATKPKCWNFSRDYRSSVTCQRTALLRQSRLRGSPRGSDNQSPSPSDPPGFISLSVTTTSSRRRVINSLILLGHRPLRCPNLCKIIFSRLKYCRWFWTTTSLQSVLTIFWSTLQKNVIYWVFASHTIPQKNSESFFPLSNNDKLNSFHFFYLFLWSHPLLL